MNQSHDAQGEPMKKKHGTEVEPCRLQLPRRNALRLSLAALALNALPRAVFAGDATAGSTASTVANTAATMVTIDIFSASGVLEKTVQTPKIIKTDEQRSEESRVGKERVSTCRSRWSTES